MLEAILAPPIHFVTETIGGYGVPAVFVLMLLESMGVLIPSEAIPPFAGYLVSDGRMTLLATVAAGVLGNLVGPWVAYFTGLWGGRELWFHYGKYVGVRAHHLDIAEKWFDKYGELTVLVSRCLPVVRTFISFPAGTSRMNFAKFSAYTFLGCVPWVFALVRAGGELGEDQGFSALPGVRRRGGVHRGRRLRSLALAEVSLRSPGAAREASARMGRWTGCSKFSVT